MNCVEALLWERCTCIAGKRENRKVEEIKPVLSVNEAYEAKIKDPLQKLADPLQVLLKHLSFV